MADRTPYASMDDVRTLWRETTEDETQRALKLLPIVSDCLRMEADKVGKDLDKMILEKPILESVAKSVTVDVVARALMTSTDTEPTTQFLQSGMGFSVSGSYLVPGGGLFIKKSELARLGLRRQRIGALHIYGENQRNDGQADQ